MFAGTNAGKADGTGGPTGWTGAKAVLVPVSGNPPIFDATGGLVPGTTTRIGALSVTGGLRNCTLGTGHATNSTYTVKASVNGLLITRAFGAAPSDAQELVAFGYSAGAPEAPYADGSIAGQTSSLPDGTVVVRLKGDYTGDGRANASDVGSFTTAVNASVTNNHTQLQAFCFDFNGDRRITAGDVSGFTWAVNNTIVCP